MTKIVLKKFIVSTKFTKNHHLFQTRREAHELYVKILEASDRRELLLEEQQALDLEKQISEARLELESFESPSELNRLEEQIVERLEKISNELDAGAEVLLAEELDMLRTLMSQNIVDGDNRDGARLRSVAAKLEVIELKLKNGGNGGDKKPDVWNPDDDEDGAAFAPDYGKLAERIRRNEAYRFLSILEDKLSVKDEDRDEQDDAGLIQKLMGLASQYNTFLINEIKMAY